MIRKTVLSLTIIFAVSFLLFTLEKGKKVLEVNADPSNTTVNVSNDPPSFTAGPVENPAVTSASPVNEGSDVTFQATANDTNGHQYYLAVCTTDAVTAGDDSAPTCDVGTWCVSSTPTDSDTQNSCNYTTQGTDSESNAWYAFVCDKVAGGGACSSPGNQGSGDSGSPFNVNHDPDFSAANGGSANPGANITFTTTASDGDSDGGDDTVKLVVCADTSGATYAGCIGTDLCASGDVASNPTCDYTLDSIIEDGSYNFYAYVFDNHEFGSLDNYRSGTYTVNNVAPVVSGVTINGGSNITLTENTTTNITVTGSISDNNSCQDLSTVTTSIYRSAVTYTSCDDNGEDDNDSCYAVVSCSVVGAGNTCDSATDGSADYTCTVATQYHADPTSGSSTADSPWWDNTWLSTVVATDNGANSHNDEVASGVEMLDLIALNVTASINYGTLDPGTDSGAVNQTTVVTATGNVGLDSELSGTTMTYDIWTIPIANQEHGLTTFTYGAGTDLSGTPTQYELNCAKTTDSGPATGNIYWGIEIPAGVGGGTYTGTNTVGAVKGETGDW